MKKSQEAWNQLTRKLEETIAQRDELKRSVVSYKSANTVMKTKVKQLSEEAAKNKRLLKEADELYEQKIAECDSLKAKLEEALNVQENTVPMTKFAELQQSIESKNEFIESLQGRVQGLMMEKSELNNKVASLTEVQIELYDTIDYLKKPWWKKIF